MNRNIKQMRKWLSDTWNIFFRYADIFFRQINPDFVATYEGLCPLNDLYVLHIHSDDEYDEELGTDPY